MASLIKNQIIKRLSKFVKNLSSNQINLSALKGEGELSGIDLDEQALEEVIELPTWLKIQKATCGRIFIKIPWTSLKTLPIQIQLDDVIIQIETSEKLRDLNKSNDSTNTNDPLIGKYGFTNRVIDGISLSINNLTFAVKAQGFKASIFLPSLDIYSTTPYWKRVDTLKLTRLPNAAKDHILIFKEISWQNARIEASASDSTTPGAAIRMIANGCRIKISMKKSLQDSSMITSRVMVEFDDLLSVVNDAQLKSALNTYKEVTQLMKRSSEQRKRNAGDKLTKLEQQQQQPSTFQPKQPTTGLNDSINLNSSLNSCQQQSNDPFRRYDVIETSLHFNIKRLDLHIIADSDSLGERLTENGSLQITIANLSLDHYPYHEFRSSKKHWVKYSEMLASNRDEWASRLYDEWNEQLNLAKTNAPNDEMSAKFERALRANHIRLFESCTIMNIDDLAFYPVSLNNNSNNNKQQKRGRPLITSDRTQYQLPEFLGVVNIQHTEYYYPLPYSFPVPNSDLYIQIMPVVVHVDFVTSSWLDAFISSLSMTIDNSGVLKTTGSISDFEHVEIKLEAMLPRIIVSSDMFTNKTHLDPCQTENKSASDKSECKKESNEQKIEVLELNVSKLSITNSRSESTSNRNKLEKHLELFGKTNFFQQNHWPLSNDSSRISPLFYKHPYETYLYNNPLTKTMGLSLLESPSTSTALRTYYTMTTDSLKKSAKYDIWHFNADSIYIDFTPISSSDSVRFEKQNLTDSLSILGWMVLDEKKKADSTTKSPWANILCILDNPSIIKISQRQYSFIMNIVDEFTLFLQTLEQNKTRLNLLKQKLQNEKKSLLNKSSNPLKITMCLFSSATFAIAIIDGLDDAMNKFVPAITSLPLPELETDSIFRDNSTTNIVFDLTSTGTTRSEPNINLTDSNSSSNNSNENLTRSMNMTGQKKTKLDDNIQRTLDVSSKGPRASSQSSLMNMNDNMDDMSSQWDQMSEDLDGDIDPALLTNEFDQRQQEKVARIELDDDIIMSPEKTKMNKIVIGTNSIESVNGVFLKLKQIQICVTGDEEKQSKSMYFACGVKVLRIEEFSSLKFDSIRPKLFENDHYDELTRTDVPSIDIRIDAKNEKKSSPQITIQLKDRTLSFSSRAIDVILKNLREIRTEEEKIYRKMNPKKMIPIDIDLKHIQLSIESNQDNSTTESNVTEKSPVSIEIHHMHLLRKVDGKLIIQTNDNEVIGKNSSQSTIEFESNEMNVNQNVQEKLRQAELTRLENEKLRSELDMYKKEIFVLRGERDSLMNTISKLDIELTQAEHQRTLQQQKPSGKK